MSTKQQKDIDKLYDHAKVANEEMSVIKEDIAVIKTELVWVKTQLNRIDERAWWILSTVILGSLITIAMSYFS